MSASVQTAWIWHDTSSGDVMGATADLDARNIMWFDQPGCACGGPEDYQTIADFLKNGAKVLTPPEDVLQEMRAQLAQYA